MKNVNEESDEKIQNIKKEINNKVRNLKIELDKMEDDLYAQLDRHKMELIEYFKSIYAFRSKSLLLSHFCFLATSTRHLMMKSIRIF